MPQRLLSLLAITLVSAICELDMHFMFLFLWCSLAICCVSHGTVHSPGEAHAADMCTAMRDIVTEENRWVSLLQIDSDTDAATAVHNIIRRQVDIVHSVKFNVNVNVKKGEKLMCSYIKISYVRTCMHTYAHT